MTPEDRSRFQSRFSEPWDQLLQRILQDEDQHPVIRDYALQHLFEYYQATIQSTPAQTVDSARRNKLMKVFWAALERKQESLAGTALLGLFYLSESDPAVDRGQLARQALDLLESRDTGELARISAFQVCGLSGERQALPKAVTAAIQTGSIPLQVSAIAAIGALGSDAELPLLRRLRGESNPSVRAAAGSAIQRIQSRTNA